MSGKATFLYRVYSLHVNEVTGNTQEVFEVSRTDPKVAYDDAYLIRSVLCRKAWVLDPSKGKV